MKTTLRVLLSDLIFYFHRHLDNNKPLLYSSAVLTTPEKKTNFEARSSFVININIQRKKINIKKLHPKKKKNHNNNKMKNEIKKVYSSI